MNRHDFMTFHSVIVNKGSGVLVNGMTSDYTYVLTAKHVISEQNTVKKKDGTELIVLNIYKHHNDKIDCAIIVVNYQADVSQQTCSVGNLPNAAPLMLVGYPELRRDTNIEIKHQNGVLVEVVDNSFVLSGDGIPPKNIILGMSGGGVYYIDNDIPYLTGVEFGMDGEDETEHFGRLRCNALSFFDDIIEKNNLRPMIPSFLECFSRIKDSIFNFNVADLSNIEELKSTLIRFVDKVVEDGLSPYFLMQRYNSKLLLSEKNNHNLKDRELWVAYCEFLIICLLIDTPEKADETYLEKLDENRRLIYYASNENWTRKLQDILIYAQSVFKEKGTLIVTSPQQNASLLPHPKTLEKVIEDISAIPQTGYDFEIDNTYENLYRNFIITHLQALHNHCVLDKEYDYKEMKIKEKIRFFKGLYYEIIK